MSDNFGVITEQGFPMGGNNLGFKPISESDKAKIKNDDKEKKPNDDTKNDD